MHGILELLHAIYSSFMNLEDSFDSNIPCVSTKISNF